MLNRIMRPVLVCLRTIVVLALTGLPLFTVLAQQRSVPAPKYVENEVIVKFRPGVHDYNRDLAHFSVAAKLTKTFETMPDVEVVKIPSNVTVKKAIEIYLAHPDVLYAEPNYIVKAFAAPNDPQFSQLWGLHNTGQSGGTVDADIDAPEAWNVTTGSSSVVVGVIDTGIDYNHQDLASNMFRNTADCNSNGIDDDGNGFIDDCFGIDTANNDSNPIDDVNHGSHVAGTIGAVGNNNVGLVGINWNVRLLACKFLDATGSGSTTDAIDCLNYIAMMRDRGVNIVATNNSWGGGAFSQALLEAIRAHRQRGILFIVAAGNGGGDGIGDNNDATPSYPCDYYLSNIICVASTTRIDSLSSFSNFGRRTVHLGAPGSEILSTTPGNTYSVFSGTSMATPHVTGVAALLKAQDPSRDWRAIKNLILAGGDGKSTLANTITQRRLNANGSLTCSNSTVLSRLQPVSDSTSATVGSPLNLAVLNIKCANPNGNVTATVNPGGQLVTLVDDGVGPDEAAGDGIYTGQWVPTAGGTYTLTFPDGAVTVQVVPNYSVVSTPFNYRTISGTNLNLGDDSAASINAPFPIQFGGGSFNNLYISSNGNVNFTSPFIEYSNVPIPTSLIATLVAPFWDDLFAVPGTAQNVFWAVTGTTPNRELIVEWRDLRYYSCASDGSTTAKFQVVFFEGSSNILFNYADPVFGGVCAAADKGGSATVGVQVASATGTQFSFNSPSLNNNTALLWTISQPSISVTPNLLDFGSVNVGSSADRSFAVQNIGGGTLTGTASTNAPYSIVSGGSYSLSAGQSQTVTIRFTPSSPGLFTGNATFNGGGGASPTLTGVGVAPRTLTVASSNPTAGVSITVSPNDNSGQGNGVTLFTRTYNNNATVTLTAAAIAGGTSFSSWSGCDSTLALTCSVTMTADKTVTASYTAVLPTVTISATAPTATEGGASGAFAVTRMGGNTSVSLAVNYAVTGTATNGTDYQMLSASVTIPANSTSAPIPVIPQDDNLVEGDETVIVTLSPSSSYTVGAPNSATVTILDNDAVPTLAYNGSLRDRVGQGNQSRGDLHLDPTFTVGFPAVGNVRTITSLRLDSNDGGVWDTNNGTGFWTLGAAANLDAALYNQPNDALSFSVASGGSFIIFASDWFQGQPFPNGLFQPGKQFTLTIGFDVGPSQQVGTTIPPNTDTTPPDTNIISGPSGTISVNTTTFTWTGSDNLTPAANLTYAYQLSPLEGSYSAFGSATTKTYTVLANDTYSFCVKAKDAAGNEDPTPACRIFTVNAPANLTFTFLGFLRDRVGAGNLAQGSDGHLDATLKLTFSAGSSARTITSLRLNSSDGGVWDTNGGTGFWTLGVAAGLDDPLCLGTNDSANCPTLPGGMMLLFASDWFLGQPFPNGLFQPGKRLTLTIGFSDGSTETPPAVTIPSNPDTTPPDTNIVSGPSGTINGNTATFTWNGSDDVTAVANLQYAYQLQPNAFSAFGSATTTTYGNLANGTYTFCVKARDQAGNEDQTPACQTFTVNIPDQILLTYNGPQQERVGQNNLSQGTDGHLDPTFTASFSAAGSTRTVTSLRLDSGDGGVWDTNGGTGFWTLGAASGLNAPLYNQSDDSVNFPVAPGESFVIFASDWFMGQPFPNGLFRPGNEFTLTIGFNDGNRTVVVTRIPPLT